MVATFPVGLGDYLMLVTNKGKTIRIPVDGIRVAGRKTQGVTLFSTEPGEHVVSVARLADAGENGDTGETEEEDRPG